MVMRQLAQDLRDEGDDLRATLATLSADDWRRPTPFTDWTAEDVIQHLTVGDFMNILSMTEPDRFVAVLEERQAARASGQRSSGTEFLDEPVGGGAELLAQWHTRLNNLCDLFAGADPKARMKWVGPDMSIRSAATARLMETWAHGQDIYDLLRLPREATDRIRNIAVLGVNTFGWTFQNRGLEPPGPPPCVHLKSPSGATWVWHEDNQSDRIEGPALDFCQVVTQGRNIAEVNLDVSGEVANAWMEIAQCFAGPPETPPPPGQRGW